jgi:AhpD family alkylhydroperoxidase
VTKSYAEIAADINRGIAKLRQGAPDAMAGFSALAKGAMKSGAQTADQKELIALAIGVARHRDGCIGFPAKELARIGTSREQVIEALAVAVYMGGGPSLMYAADAMHAFDEFQTEASPARRHLGRLILPTPVIRRTRPGPDPRRSRIVAAAEKKAGQATSTISAESGDFDPLPAWNKGSHIEIPVWRAGFSRCDAANANRPHQASDKDRARSINSVT